MSIRRDDFNAKNNGDVNNGVDAKRASIGLVHPPVVDEIPVPATVDDEEGSEDGAFVSEEVVVAAINDDDEVDDVATDAGAGATLMVGVDDEDEDGKKAAERASSGAERYKPSRPSTLPIVRSAIFFVGRGRCSGHANGRMIMID
jgi:hypothetical protein